MIDTWAADGNNWCSKTYPAKERERPKLYSKVCENGKIAIVYEKNLLKGWKILCFFKPLKVGE